MAKHERFRAAIVLATIVLGSTLPSLTGCNFNSIYPATPTAGHPTTPTPLPAPSLAQRGFLRTDDSHNTNSQPFPQSVLAGDVIVVAITQFQGVVSGVSDSQNDPFTAISTQQVNTSPDNDYVELYYAKDVKGGPTSVSVVFSETTDANVGIYEFSHLSTLLSPLDSTVATKDSSNTPDGGPITTTQNSEVIFVVGVDDDGRDSAGHIVPPTAGSGYTLLDHVDDDQQYERFYDEYRIVSPGAYQTNFKIASTIADWGVIGASFKQ